MSWFARLFNRRTAAPDPQRESAGLWPMALVPSDLRLSPEEMLSTSVAWGCIRAIVDPIASSEIKVFTRNAAGGRVHLVDDEISYLLNVRPSADLTAQAFKEIALTQTIVHGDGYAEIVWNRAAKVHELVPLNSERMRVQRDGDALVYVYRQGDGSEVVLFADEVLHFRGPSIRGLTGDSVVYRASKAVALHVAQEKFATAYFANGTVLGGVVKMPGGLTNEAKESLRAALKARFGGAKKAHGVIVLEAGMDYEPLGSHAGESQLVPSRQFSVEEVARYFGVPLVRLGVQASAQGYGTNVAQLNLQFVRDTLTPWVNRFTEEATFKLFPERAPWRSIEIDTTWLTVGDDEQRARAREINIRSGITTVNEGRAEEGKPGIGPAGDLHLVQRGLTILDEEALRAPSQPALPPPANEMAPGVVAVLGALEKYARQARARRADLEQKGKTPEEIAANLAATLRPKALAALASAIDGLPVDSGPEGREAGE